MLVILIMDNIIFAIHQMARCYSRIRHNLGANIREELFLLIIVRKEYAIARDLYELIWN